MDEGGTKRECDRALARHRAAGARPRGGRPPRHLGGRAAGDVWHEDDLAVSLDQFDSVTCCECRG
jgi:hypothetical protein